MKEKSGTLYLVPTPIGNLKDITLRALEVLKTVELIAAEDTRNSQFLLKHYNIDTRLISYHQHNEKKRSLELINNLTAGKDVAVISDAGSPGISDPGSVLVNAAIQEGIRVEALPGATAFVPALTSSGLNSDRFCFIGFLPDKNKDRKSLLERIESYQETLIFYVSPHDIDHFAIDLYDNFSNRNICIGRELTKIYEEYIYGTLKDLAEKKLIFTRKGEFVVIVEGKKEVEISDDFIVKNIRSHRDNGVTNKDIIEKITSDYKVKPNRVKKLLYQ